MTTSPIPTYEGKNVIGSNLWRLVVNKDSVEWLTFTMLRHALKVLKWDKVWDLRVTKVQSLDLVIV